MLCQFAFKNFGSFKDEAFLDLCAESISEMRDSLIVDSDGEKYLPVISIYGPNGGGKSTVLEALAYLIYFVNNPIYMTQMRVPEVQVPHFSGGSLRHDIYYKFDEESRNHPTDFDLLFRRDGYEFRYEISIKDGAVVSENLYSKKIGTRRASIIFERSSEGIETGEELKNLPLDKVRSSFPLISYISTAYDIDIINRAISWFSYSTILNYDNPQRDRNILIPEDKKRLKQLLSMLQSMDINITDVRIEEDEKGRIIDIYTIHEVNGKKFELNLKEESSGTRKLFSCLSRIEMCLEEGRLLIADELDAKLHPKILGYIIEQFQNPAVNKAGAQLILTSHDMVNMNPDVFRRDEIWFCSQGHDYSSNLYSLVAFRDGRGQKVRKDEVYSKRYLEGHYGADPYIMHGLNWERKDEQ